MNIIITIVYVIVAILIIITFYDINGILTLVNRKIVVIDTTDSSNTNTNTITIANSNNDIDYNIKQNNSTDSTMIELQSLQYINNDIYNDINANDTFIEGDDEENITPSNTKRKHHPNVRTVVYLKYNNNSSIDDKKDKSSKVSMVPYPGLKKYNGFLPHGQWISGTYSDDMTRYEADFLQFRARKDGYYVSSNNSKPINLHIFSTYEAAECLRNKRVIIVGDSYMKQMFIGAVDVMLQNPSNTEIEGGKYRELVSRQAAKCLSQSRAIKIRNIHLSYDDKCVHSNLNCLINNLEKNRYYRQADYLISNILVHDLESNQNRSTRLSEYVNNLEVLFANPKSKLMWVTGPSYDLKKVPDKYLEVTKNRPTVAANKRAFELADKHGIPILDFYSLTANCRWKNCSTDGGHRSRFVNRMKFQLVFNNIC